MSAAAATPWGYDVAGEVPPLVFPDEFEAMTGGAFAASDDRVEPVLAAASAAVRAYCGWHVSPVLSCVAKTQGPGSVIELPSMRVASVGSVTSMGVSLGADEYEWRRDGLIRRKPPTSWPWQWGSVVVEFGSGFEPEAVPDLAAVVCQVAANALAASPGVRSEQAGSVRIEYNQTAYGVTGGVGLLSRDMAMLSCYRLPPVPR